MTYRNAMGRMVMPMTILAAAAIAFIVGDTTDAGINVSIVLVSALLGFWQERGATDAVQRLRSIIGLSATGVRDDQKQDVPVADIMPGYLVHLSAGDTVPGDGVLVESTDLYVNEATLTGKTYPVEKSPGTVAAETPLSQRTNALFMGTNVVSGAATALIVHTGRETVFGSVTERLRLRPPETEFERSVRRFGQLLSEVTLPLVVAIFAINVYLTRPVLDSFLFALALAVGLTPQLLPAIISINLADGASRMAREKVIVKHLPPIENFGSIGVLC